MRLRQIEPCAPRPRRKEQWPYTRLTQTCLWVSRSLQQRHRSVVACCRVGDTECSSTCMGSFEGGHHCLYYLHHSLVSDQTAGKEHSPSTKNWIKDLLSTPLPMRTRPSFPNSQPLSLGSFHEPLILTHQREENHNHRKLIKLTTWTTDLSNSMKLWTMPCRDT